MEKSEEAPCLIGTKMLFHSSFGKSRLTVSPKSEAHTVKTKGRISERIATGKEVGRAKR